MLSLLLGLTRLIIFIVFVSFFSILFYLTSFFCSEEMNSKRALHLRDFLIRVSNYILGIRTIIYGEKGTTDLLVLSQVILSMQLSFAVVPLVMFTGSKLKMGEFVNKFWLKVLVWIIAAIIIILNLYLFIQTVFPS